MNSCVCLHNLACRAHKTILSRFEEAHQLPLFGRFVKAVYAHRVLSPWAPLYCISSAGSCSCQARQYGNKYSAVALHGVAIDHERNNDYLSIERIPPSCSYDSSRGRPHSLTYSSGWKMLHHSQQRRSHSFVTFLADVDMVRVSGLRTSSHASGYSGWHGAIASAVRCAKMQQLSALPCSCCSLMRHSIVADSTPTISLRVDYDDHHVASCFQKTYFDVVFSSKRKSKSGFFHHFYCFGVPLTKRVECSRCSGSM